MKCLINRDSLLGALQKISGAIDKKGNQVITSHILVQVNSHQMRLTGTDQEVEITSLVMLKDPAEAGELTLPAKKFIDICRALPEGSILLLKLDENNKATIKEGKSKFTLLTLDPASFPKIEFVGSGVEFSISQTLLKSIIEKTCFSIAQQDVRYYLNGLFLQVQGKDVIAVGTDGHRMSIVKHKIVQDVPECEIIIPRKGINELMRLLSEEEEEIKISINYQHVSISSETFIFRSKKIAGKFPPYENVIPKNVNKKVIADRDLLKQALARVSILSNEKYRAVQLQLRKNVLILVSKNPDQEEASEEIGIDYNGIDLNIAFNVDYLLDVLNHVSSNKVVLEFSDPSSSALMKPLQDEYDSNYIVMPMQY